MELTNKYLTYDEYTELGGGIPEVSFKNIEYKAEIIIDEQTFGRFKKIEEYPNELKMCVYDIVTAINNADGTIISESDGDYSVTYATANDLKKTQKGIIKQWLSNVKVNGVPVLYCGADVSENRYNHIS